MLTKSPASETLFVCGGRKARFAMFFKGIALALLAVGAYFAYQRGFDYQESLFYVLMPATAVLGCLMLDVDR